MREADRVVSGPLRVYCPKCAGFRAARSLPLKKVGAENARRTYFVAEPDIAWVRRRRTCSVCSTEFKSAEANENLVHELYALRQKLKGLRSKAVQAAVQSIRGKRAWINASQDVPYEVARGLVASSAWWLRHSSGRPVRAAGHANRLRRSPIGWGVAFGANGFAAGHAAAQAREIARDVMDRLGSGESVSEPYVRQRLRYAVLASVFNHCGELYPAGSYAMEGDDLVFGTTSIHVGHCEEHLFEQTGLKELFATSFAEFDA